MQLELEQLPAATPSPSANACIKRGRLLRRPAVYFNGSRNETLCVCKAPKDRKDYKSNLNVLNFLQFTFGSHCSFARIPSRAYS